MNVRVALISLYNSCNVSIRHIHSYLKHNGCDVRIIYFKDSDVNDISPPTQKEIQLLLNDLETFKPDITGISVGCSSFAGIAGDLTSRIGNAIQTLIVWGGIHPTLQPEASLKYADIVCRLSGEQPMLDLARCVNSNSSWSGIPNLSYRLNDEIHHNQCEQLSDLEERLPPPDFSDAGKIFIQNDQIEEIDPHRNNSWQYITFTRLGCFRECSYCCNTELIRENSGWIIRERSIESVIRELEVVKEQLPHVSRILFADEIFCRQPQWTRLFMEHYRNRVGLPFSCQFSAPFVDENTIRILKSGGLTEVYIGVESGSERVRREIFNRHESSEDIIRACRILNRSGIRFKIDLIMDNPMENTEDKHEHLTLLLSLPKPFEINMFSLTFFPNTELTSMALEQKIISEEDVEGDGRKVFSRWAVYLDHPRSASEEFWIAMTGFTGKRWIPNSLIRRMSRSGFLRRHTRLLLMLLRVNVLIWWGARLFTLLRSGQLSPSLAGQSWRHVFRSVK